MPTYDFRCPGGHEFERFFRKISDSPTEVPCPECGQTAIRLVSGGAGLHFKGSGFYLTDYGKNAHRKSASPSDGKKKGDAGGESKGAESTAAESKPAESRPAVSGAEPKPAESKPAKPPRSGSGEG